MAFIFRCDQCNWASPISSGSDVGPPQTIRTCPSCQHVETSGQVYAFTNSEVLIGEMPCRAGCGSIARLHTLAVGSRSYRNAQVGEKEASAVAINYKTGEIVYPFGDDPSKPLSEEWRKQGFEKKQFPSFHELQQFCRATGQVNDIEGDYHKDDGYFEEDLARRRKGESEQRRSYMHERELAKRASRG